MRTGLHQATLEDERRSEGRRKLLLSTAATQAGRSRAVEILDLSAKGLLISTLAELDVGEPLAVILADGIAHSATIAWSSDTLFGCKFERPLTRAELSASLLLADPPRGGALPQTDAGKVTSEATSQVTLGQRIRALRMESPHTMEELADLAGVSKPTLWKWETDRVRPRQDAIERLAAVLGVEEIELLYGKDAWEARLQSAIAPAAPPDGTLAKLVDDTRQSIAAAAGVAPDRVKIEIDFS